MRGWRLAAAVVVLLSAASCASGPSTRPGKVALIRGDDVAFFSCIMDAIARRDASVLEPLVDERTRYVFTDAPGEGGMARMTHPKTLAVLLARRQWKTQIDSPSLLKLNEYRGRTPKGGFERIVQVEARYDLPEDRILEVKVAFAINGERRTIRSLELTDHCLRTS